jgi:2-oxoglutarate ferredoxin oxidoreductase subunit alpha
MSSNPITDRSLSIAITGAGGAGVISCGELLLQAWARAGGRGLLRKAFGPQIRGGESAALLKLTADECYTAANHYQVLLALDWANFGRFEDEIQLGPDSIVICETGSELPDSVAALGVQVITVSMAELAKSTHLEGRVNMLALGVLGNALGLSRDDLCALAERKLQAKPEAYREAATACIHCGFEQSLGLSLEPPPAQQGEGWYISGNQAAGLGALEAGVRFVAAYPITPASDVLEWMAGGLEQVGGQLLQAEDELAAINMTIGASFGGVPSFTATSGPGLALMSESIGLAVASETPVTVFNVMRGGPSTGIPTKSEQSDLNIAIHGLHGDAPHLVLAPLNIADCVFTAAWAVQLAQHLQTAAIVLSDQFLGQSSAVVSEPRRSRGVGHHDDAPPDSETGGNDYLRYRLTASGVSTMAVPGDPDQRFTADGLEHNQKGTPSARQSDHKQQLNKRQHKLTAFDYGDDWAQLSGDGAVALVCFGSTSAVVREAGALLAEQGLPIKTVALRLLAPLQCDALQQALAGCSQIFVVEQNHGAQLFHYLRGQLNLSGQWISLAEPGPVPLNAQQIMRQLKEVNNNE